MTCSHTVATRGKKTSQEANVFAENTPTPDRDIKSKTMDDSDSLHSLYFNIAEQPGQFVQLYGMRDLGTGYNLGEEVLLESAPSFSVMEDLLENPGHGTL